jgi:3-deoxy-manno-octulosonate cytidylyltransferase (CMP-KDO synthetase)
MGIVGVISARFKSTARGAALLLRSNRESRQQAIDGERHSMQIAAVIPARFASTRLAGKPLVDIHGKPMIQHVYECALRARSLSRVIVATDDDRVLRAVERFGGTAVLTRPDHASGTDRVAEAAEKLDAEIVVNIQGDEPLMDPEIIDECVGLLRANPGAEMSTVIKQIEESSFQDSAVVKVVCDLAGRALYFSRALVPYPRNRTDEFRVFEHVGIYAYRKQFLLRFARLEPTPLERIEGLEQLRALEHGIAIYVAETRCRSELISVDTPADLERVRGIIADRLQTKTTVKS